MDPGTADVIRENDVDLNVDMLVDADVAVAEERQIVEAMNQTGALRDTQSPVN